MTVTLDTSQVKNWQHGGSSGKVRFFLNKTITTEDGAQYQRGDTPRLGAVSVNGFFTETTHTVSGSVVTVATAVLPVTESARDNPDATVTAAILDDDNKVKAYLFQNFRIPETLGTVVQLEDLVLHNNYGLPLRDTSVYNKTEVNLLLSNKVAGTGAPPATTLVQGIGRISGVPLDVNDPVFLGTTDLEWTRQDKVTLNVLEYASLAAAITAIGATDVTLLIPSSVTVSANLTIPANVTLWFAGSGAINISGSSTVVTVNGAMEVTGRLRQIFTGATTNSNVIFGARVPVIKPEWWGTGATAIQSAFNALPAGGVIEVSTPYAAQTVPIYSTKANINLRGNQHTAHGYNSIGISGNVYGPLVYFGDPAALTYAASLATGPGQSLTLSGTTLHLDGNSQTNLNGLAAFSVRCKIKPSAIPSSGAQADIISSFGSVKPTAGYEAFSLHLSANGDANDGKVRAAMTVGGVSYSLLGSTVLIAGTTYDLQLSYDGATIRLFVNGVAEATQAASGTVTQRAAEDVVIGSRYLWWPRALGILFNAMAGQIDCVELSNVARNVAPFTPSTSKPTSDANTLLLLNFDTELGPFVVATSKDGNVYLPRHISATFLHNEVVEGLTLINPKGVALFYETTPHSRVENVAVSGVVGFLKQGQCFLNEYKGIRATTNLSTSKVGVMLAGGYGANGAASYWTGGDIEGFPYGLAVGDGGFSFLQDLFINTNSDTVVPIYLITYILTLDNVWLDDEAAPAGGVTRLAGAIIYGAHRINIRGGQWWMSQSAVPIFILDSIGTGNISGIRAIPSASATSIIDFAGTPPTSPIHLNNVQRTSATVPYTTSAEGDYVEINGDKTINQTAKTALYTLTDADYCVVGDTTAGGFTFTLPAVAGRQGKEYVIQNVGSANTLTVAGNAAELIGAANTYTKLTGLSVFKIKCNGVKWLISQEWFNPAIPGAIGGTTPAAGAFTTVSATGQVTSTLATGTAPLVIASTTKVSNLNVDQLDGADWAAPAAIGSGTPAAGSFTTVSATEQVTSTLATGTAPLVVASTTKVANLNVDQVDGGDWAAPGAIGTGTPAAATFTTVVGNTSVTSPIHAMSASEGSGLLVEQKLFTLAGVDLNVTTKTNLFTVPASRTLIVTKVVIRNASTSLTTASFGVGFNANADDVVASAVHAELTGSTLLTILLPKVGAIRGAAADVFGIKASIAQGGAATVTVDVHGYLF